MMDQFTLRNARVVTPTGIVEGALCVRDAVIQDVCSGHLHAASAIDAQHDYILPGLIDIHTDNLERHLLPRPNADWPVMAALIAHDAQLAAAGITTVLDSLCVGTEGGGVRNFQKVEEAIRTTGQARSRGLFRTDHLLHLRAELSHADFPAMFDRLHQNPDVRLVSLMDHTPGQRQMANLELYRSLLRKEMKLSEPEIEDHLAKSREAHEKYYPRNRRYALSVMSGRGIALASHDDSTVDHVEQAHDEGIIISEFPTTMLAARAARQRAMHIVAGGPNLVLGRSHSGNIAVAELAHANLVDVLSSDYAPSSLLHGAFLLQTIAAIPLQQAIATVTSNPAQLVGLHDRGTLEPGKRADLIRVRIVDDLPLVISVWREGARVA
jgi:alpha-D-ribose 1-methylphosphonate 5-triphosphate diphosphatase